MGFFPHFPTPAGAAVLRRGARADRRGRRKQIDFSSPLFAPSSPVCPSSHLPTGLVSADFESRQKTARKPPRSNPQPIAPLAFSPTSRATISHTSRAAATQTTEVFVCLLVSLIYSSPMDSLFFFAILFSQTRDGELKLKGGKKRRAKLGDCSN